MPEIQILRKVGTDEYVEQTASAEGRASVSLPDGQAGDYFANISLQRIPTATTHTLDGRNANVGASTTETIWTPGGNYFPPANATVITIVSDNINDTAAGTGAKSVLVMGLDSNRLHISEVVALDGDNPVTTIQLFIRMNTVNVFGVGTGKSNLGAITFTIDTQTVGVMRAQSSFLQEGVLSLAQNESYVINTVSLSVSKNGEAALFARINLSFDGGISFQEAQFGPLVSTFQTTSGIGYPFSRKFFAPKMDVIIEAENPGTATGVSCVVSGIIYDES